VKEAEVATVEFPFLWERVGYGLSGHGKLGIWRGAGLQSWFVDVDGRGNDGSQVILPVERDAQVRLTAWEVVLGVDGL